VFQLISFLGGNRRPKRKILGQVREKEAWNPIRRERRGGEIEGRTREIAQRHQPGSSIEAGMGPQLRTGD